MPASTDVVSKCVTLDLGAPPNQSMMYAVFLYRQNLL